MQSQLITNQTQAQMCHNQDQTIARLEVQIEQLAATVREREKGHFPSQTVPNPRGQPAPQNTPTGQFEISSDSNRQVQAIHTLRSGKRVDNQVQDPPNNPNIVKEKEKRNQRSQQRKMIKLLLTIKINLLCPKPHFLNVFNQLRKKSL